MVCSLLVRRSDFAKHIWWWWRLDSGIVEETQTVDGIINPIIFSEIQHSSFEPLILGLLLIFEHSA